MVVAVVLVEPVVAVVDVPKVEEGGSSQLVLVRCCWWQFAHSSSLRLLRVVRVREQRQRRRETVLAVEYFRFVEVAQNANSLRRESCDRHPTQEVAGAESLLLSH